MESKGVNLCNFDACLVLFGVILLFSCLVILVTSFHNFIKFKVLCHFENVSRCYDKAHCSKRIFTNSLFSRITILVWVRIARLPLVWCK